VTGRLDLLNAIASAAMIARERSFRAAMRETGSGFRKLQKQVEILEKELGFIIFHRTADGVVPTPEGRLILEKAEQIDAIVSDVMRLGKTLDNQTQGEVLLAATEGLGTFWVSPQLGAFTALHQAISIKLNPSMALVDMRRFEVDLAIQVVEPTLPAIKRVRLGKLHMVLSASAAYLDRRGEPKQLAELGDHDFVFHMSPQSSDRQIIERIVGCELRQSQSVVMRNSSAHYLTVENGIGIGFLPSYIFALGSQVVPLKLPVRYELDIWLCFHEDGRRTPRIARVIDWLNAIFDPRLFPWFRREFVHPARFGQIIEDSGSQALIQAIKLPR
jgi:DNA-binding transcriptional LysR family regulator